MAKRKRKVTPPSDAAKELVPSGLALGDPAKLEAEVARMKARGVAWADGMRIPPLHAHRNEPHHIREDIEAFRLKHGLTDERVAAIEEDMEADREADRKARAKEQREAAWRVLCPHEMMREPFNMELVKPEVPRWKLSHILNWKFGPKGMFIIGETGHSKTRAVYSMLRREAIEKNRSAMAISGIAFATECSAALGAEGNLQVFLRRWNAPDIVFIDDLAKRFTAAAQQGFFEVLDKRTANRKPMLITTNVSGELLEAMIHDKQLSAPMLRRMREYCEVVVI